MGGGDDRKGALGCLVVVLGVVVVLLVALGKDLALQADPPAAEPVATANIRRLSPPSAGDGVARAYSVTKLEDLSTGERTRHRYWIVADDAKTFNDRAATVIKAAQDLKQQTHTQEAFVLLEASAALTGKGYVLAMTDFVYDSDTPWVVKSSDILLDYPIKAKQKQLNYIFLKEVNP